MNARKFLMYFPWSRPKEIAADLGTLENRYPAVFEERRLTWLTHDHTHRANERQGIDGFIEGIFRSRDRFNTYLRETLRTEVTVIEREGEAPAPRRVIDDAMLSRVHTLIIQSFDHDGTQQVPEQSEIEAIRRFLARPEADLVIAPHHVIGDTDDPGLRKAEAFHHQDSGVPSQDVSGGYAKRLIEALGFPIEVRYGLNPAVTTSGEPAPIEVSTEDRLGILEGVKTFGAHAHLPELHVEDPTVKVLARQKINRDVKPHPHIPNGQEWFNAFLWIPADGARKGNVFVCDLTLFSLGFGGADNLKRLWTNLAHRST